MKTLNLKNVVEKKLLVDIRKRIGGLMTSETSVLIIRVVTLEGKVKYFSVKRRGEGDYDLLSVNLKDVSRK